MSFRKNSRGRYDAYADGRSQNRYISSFEQRDDLLSIAVLFSVLLLAIITCIFFCSYEHGAFPTINIERPSEIKGSHIPETPDPTKPYMTISNKTNFIAGEGGEELGSFVKSEHAILVRLSDFSTLAYKDADAPIYPASMTKIMTVLVALDLVEDLDEKYTVKKEVLSRIPSGASRVGYVEGSVETMREMLYGVARISGADAVLCVVDALGLSMSDFVSLMNEKAKKIGLENTHFGGAIGMDDENNRSTCRDIAALMAYAMENPQCEKFLGSFISDSESVYQNSTLDKNLKRLDMNVNTAVKGYSIIAAKSGFEDRALHCLASYVKNTETGEGFVLVTAKAPATEESPTSQNTIWDLINIFKKIKP